MTAYKPTYPDETEDEMELCECGCGGIYTCGEQEYGPR